MFKLKTSDTFTWPVSFDWPDEGQHKRKQFNATFRIQQTRPENNLDEAGAAQRFIDEVLVDLDLAFDDESGTPLEMSVSEKKAVAIAHPIIGPALVLAYYDGIKGRQRKN